MYVCNFNKNELLHKYIQRFCHFQNLETGIFKKHLSVTASNAGLHCVSYFQRESLFCFKHVIFIFFFYFYYFFGITSPLRGDKNALTSESYPLSEMPRTLIRMKAVPSNAAFCKQLIAMGIPMVFWWFSSSSLTVPKAPATISITLALTSRNFCTCNLKSWYLVIFSSSFTLMF